MADPDPVTVEVKEKEESDSSSPEPPKSPRMDSVAVHESSLATAQNGDNDASRQLPGASESGLPSADACIGIATHTGTADASTESTKHTVTAVSSSEDEFTDAVDDNPTPFRSSFSFKEQREDKNKRSNSIVPPLPDPSSQPSQAAPKPHTPRPEPGYLQRFLIGFARRLRRIDFLVTRKALRIWEWCDLDWTPDVVRHTCQDILTKQWMRKLPLLQPASPADIASRSLVSQSELSTFKLVQLWHLRHLHHNAHRSQVVANVSSLFQESVVNRVARSCNGNLEVFEFCAGSGGPTPAFEKLINESRVQQGDHPILFSISDKYPNIDAWSEYATGSSYLRVISESVDAVDPPSIALSHGSSQDGEKPTSDRRIFRLFNLSFHHFEDGLAIDILRSTMETADGFAIVELQDRRFFTLSMMFFNFFFVLFMTPKIYTPPEGQRKYGLRNLIRSTVTYWGVVCVLWWDGLVSCLRVREFNEFKELVKAASGSQDKLQIQESLNLEGGKSFEVAGWQFREHSVELHTIPSGFVKMFTGVGSRSE